MGVSLPWGAAFSLTPSRTLAVQSAWPVHSLVGDLAGLWPSPTLSLGQTQWGSTFVSFREKTVQNQLCLARARGKEEAGPRTAFLPLLGSAKCNRVTAASEPAIIPPLLAQRIFAFLSREVTFSDKRWVEKLVRGWSGKSECNIFGLPKHDFLSPFYSWRNSDPVSWLAALMKIQKEAEWVTTINLLVNWNSECLRSKHKRFLIKLVIELSFFLSCWFILERLIQS